MSLKIALAGNPNCGKTTLFNALTGSNQYVGNWPGVTVEKKEGRLKNHKDVVIMDLPGIYSLSPYTLEEVVARNYLIGERPDAIINIVDGTNIERNLYLTTQIIELGFPVVIAINMMDLVVRRGDKIDIKELGEKLGCEVVEISALKGTGVTKAAEKAVAAARAKRAVERKHNFDPDVEAAIASAEAKLDGLVDEGQKRFFAIKLLERDSKISEQIKALPDVDDEIKKLEEEFDDDTESIITNERYAYISSIIGGCVKKASEPGSLSVSDKIDRVVTNRILAIPIFVVVMFLVYYISMVTVGSWATDWVNDNLFDAGFHLFGIGGAAYEDAADEYGSADEVVNAFVDYEDGLGIDVSYIADALDTESEEYDADLAAGAVADLVAMVPEDVGEISYLLEDEETLETSEESAGYADLIDAAAVMGDYGYEEPDPADYGIFVPS
ncbi:MAG: ferrous iron transporter B, partial [Clostridiales bacterium]|nr:ferrous iron transporter B [Clostridiales bacterium]